MKRKIRFPIVIIIEELKSYLLGTRAELIETHRLCYSSVTKTISLRRTNN